MKIETTRNHNRKEIPYSHVAVGMLVFVISNSQIPQAGGVASVVLQLIKMERSVDQVVAQGRAKTIGIAEEVQVDQLVQAEKGSVGWNENGNIVCQIKINQSIGRCHTNCACVLDQLVRTMGSSCSLS